MSIPTTPALAGFHHVDLTVSDVEASETWYARVLGFQRIFLEKHATGPGYAVLMLRPGTHLHLGLSHHDSNHGERFDETRTGLDHVSFAVATREELDAWAAHLTEQNVPHSGITERAEPMPHAVLVLRDPDNIQLEMIHS